MVDAKRILRELKFLRHFNHENIISLIDIPYPNLTGGNFEDVYMVTELMETDLYKVIYSKQQLSSDHIKFFIYQTLKALKYLHSANVIHRDLKPSNLLVNSNCEIKLCDFGLARFTDAANSSCDDLCPPQSSALTEYVVTRWYRAPEVMLSCQQYDAKIDVWAVGCIMAELVLRKPFFPGSDYLDQLKLIVQNVGSLEDEDMKFISSNKAKRFMKKQAPCKGINFEKVFRFIGSDGVSLLKDMLAINPEKRVTASEALSHQYFDDLHCIETEPVYDYSQESAATLYQEFDIDDVAEDSLTKQIIQRGILNEVQHFH